MRVDVTNCDDCPLCSEDDEGFSCCHVIGVVKLGGQYDEAMPTNCPLLNGDITIGVMGDGDDEDDGDVYEPADENENRCDMCTWWQERSDCKCAWCTHFRPKRKLPKSTHPWAGGYVIPTWCPMGGKVCE